MFRPLRNQLESIQIFGLVGAVVGRVLCWTGRHNDTCPRGTAKAMRHITTGRYVRWPGRWPRV